MPTVGPVRTGGPKIAKGPSLDLQWLPAPWTLGIPRWAVPSSVVHRTIGEIPLVDQTILLGGPDDPGNRWRKMILGISPVTHNTVSHGL